MSDNIDYRGARGSNAGDQFHELWALLQILALLQPDTPLCAVGVEGVKSEYVSDGDGAAWDGVDVTLYHGAASLERADRVEFAQLKYSSADPETPWSIARLVRSSAKKGNNSVARKLANAFRAGKEKLKAGATLKVRFISNQPAASDLLSAFSTKLSKNVGTAAVPDQVKRDLEVLQSATGLPDSEFTEFVACLDISECGHGSRFALHENIISLMIGYLGDDVSSVARELQMHVRNLMLPERASEVVTQKDLLLWFGLSSRDGLFPCEPDIRLPDKTIRRSAANEVLSQLATGERIVLVHGVGGCGKTTLMRQIEEGLPLGSVSVNFDCFGGGRYLYSNDKRHLPEKAFLQLANDIALALQLPLFIPRDLRHPADIRLFLNKIGTAALVLEKISTEALLVIIIDAADNSVAAAQSVSPPERSFLLDITGANLAELPSNVRFVFSARTSRKASLCLPRHAVEVECPLFDLSETREHLETVISAPSASYVEQFYSLSHQNPRVQSYAISASGGDQNKLLDALRPGGKTLPDVLQMMFDSALKKLGQSAIFDKLLAALANLPPPAHIGAIARIVGATDAIVQDWARDLAPGLRIHDGSITTADEDFENYIKNTASVDQNETLGQIAEDFVANYKTDSYASSHVADALVAASRPNELLRIIENDPQVAAISDPVQRRQVQVRRLWLSLAACREAGTPVEALKTILISAEAQKDESTLTDFLEKELDLSVEFSGPSLRRLIILNRERVAEHGPFLAHDAARASRAGDHITAREQLHFYDAWLRIRRKVPETEARSWQVEDRDIAARTEAIFNLAGPEAAYEDLMRWSPRDVPLRVANILIPQLIAGGSSDALRDLIDNKIVPAPWNLVLLAALAMAGEPVQPAEVERSLSMLRKRFIPDPELVATSYDDDEWRRNLLGTFVVSCELGYRLGIDGAVLSKAIDCLLSVLEAKSRTLYNFNFHRFDALIRCHLLRATLRNEQCDAKGFFNYLKSLGPPPNQELSGEGGKKKKRKKTKKQPSRDDREERSAETKVNTLFPIYTGRVKILTASRSGTLGSPNLLAPLGPISGAAWEFDHDHDSIYLRALAARAIMDLLIIPDLSAVDLEAKASGILRGRYADWLAMRRAKLWERMRIRPNEANALIQLVAGAANEVREAKASASDKLEIAIRLARLVMPVSRDDAAALFNEAISIAKEIDEEAIDQIEFFSVAASAARIEDQSECRRVAGNMFTFVSAVCERLSGRDFNWDAAVIALVSLDLPSALAAAGRWADDGTVNLDTTVETLIPHAVNRGLLSSTHGAALAHLLERSDKATSSAIVAHSSPDQGTQPEAIEDTARRALLFSSQAMRPGLCEAILEMAPETLKHGPWMERLQQTAAFAKTLKKEKEPVTPHRRMAITPQILSGVPEEFEFEATGPFLTATEIERVLKAANESGLRHSDYDILEKMMTASSNAKHRVSFLNAVSTVSDDVVWGDDRARILISALKQWKNTPALERWCRKDLPHVLVSHFHSFARWMKQGQTALPEILKIADLDADSRIEVILSGVAEHGNALGSRALFGIAELISDNVDAAQLASLISWYADRLLNRIPPSERSILPSEDIPLEADEAIGRLVFALMSDIDTRIRWRAAHCFRILARLQCRTAIACAIAQRDREQDAAFRDPSAPFYFLAAKFWLVLAMYRVAAESPSILQPFKTDIFKIATSSSFPHVGIREYAKRIILLLHSDGFVSLNNNEKSALLVVNQPKKGKTRKKVEDDISFHNARDEGRRFRFDAMDTLPYWYEDILRIFPTVSPNAVLDIAERWIVDQWGADAEAHWWDKEPRKGRYDERRFGLWSHRHGSLPVVERYGTYLEWHAMHCAIGELLTNHPISAGGHYYDRFDYWLGRSLPTAPPLWLSDHRAPTPLEKRLWIDDPRTDKGWLYNAGREDILTEVGLLHSSRPGWLIVDAYYTAHFPKREARASIKTAIVSSSTGRSLVRALQTAKNPYDFRIPDEDDDLEINTPDYKLIGWIAHKESDVGFDDRDPAAYEIGQVRVGPGKELARLLRLERKSDSQTTWICRKSGESALIYEAWSDEPPPEDEFYPRRTKSDGWRLWARVDIIQAFLQKEKMDLICEVQIDRRLRSEYSRSYEPDAKKKTHDRILLFREDGRLEDANRSLGPWTGNRR